MWIDEPTEVGVWHWVIGRGRATTPQLCLPVTALTGGEYRGHRWRRRGSGTMFETDVIVCAYRYRWAPADAIDTKPTPSVGDWCYACPGGTVELHRVIAVADRQAYARAYPSETDVVIGADDARASLRPYPTLPPRSDGCCDVRAPSVGIPLCPYCRARARARRQRCADPRTQWVCACGASSPLYPVDELSPIWYHTAPYTEGHHG